MIQLFRTTPSVSPREAQEKLVDEKTCLVDVRTEEEYAVAHARNARNIPLGDIEDSVGSLRGFGGVYVICASGGRSARAVTYLLGEGINAFNVNGGTAAWSREGLPME